MTRALFLIFILLFGCEGAVHAQAPYRQSSAYVTHADVDFFFNSITLKNDICEFKLSPNTIGMLWRIKSNKLDNTGACQSGQVLTLPSSASLEIKRKDIDLNFLPLGPGVFNVHLTIKPEDGVSHEIEEREASRLAVKSNGSYGIMIVEE